MKVLLLLQRPSQGSKSRKITILFNLHPESTQDAKMPEGSPKRVSSEKRREAE